MLKKKIKNCLKAFSFFHVYIQNEPYTMLKQNSDILRGNDQYEGFAIDLIFRLSLLLEFKYEIILQNSVDAGVCTNEERNEWDGMIGKVMSGVSFCFVLFRKNES